ncbi:MAG TPA: hypothetical protein VFS43_27840 [Polyangiaceae bacterium]|nr:hypothetical protein [Polyangiaceae bacterium]
MTVRTVVTSKRPCRLGPGELRRVPQNRTSRGLVGYHLGCPRCGFVTVALEGHQGLAIAESDDGQRVSFSTPVRCTFCAVLVHLTDGKARLEEDALVRPVRSRRG